MAPPCPSKDDKLADGSNFAHWRLTMTLWFKKKGLWEIVDGTEKKPERLASSSKNRWSQFMEDEFLKSAVDWDIQNMKALSAIAQSLTKEVSPLINNLSAAHAAWTALVDYFNRDSTM